MSDLVKRLADALQRLADAADEVGVKHFDDDSLSLEVETMQSATLDARFILRECAAERGKAQPVAWRKWGVDIATHAEWRTLPVNLRTQEFVRVEDVQKIVDRLAAPPAAERGELQPVAWGVVHQGRVLFAHEHRQQCENLRALGNPNATVEPLYLAAPPAAPEEGKPVAVFKAKAYLTDEHFGYDRFVADMYSCGRGTHDALITILSGDIPSWLKTSNLAAAPKGER